jgi:CheY-like chemotaxis protein
MTDRTRQFVPGARTSREAHARILYIEDNPLNVLLVEELLAAQPGAELVSAATAKHGLQLARQQKPALILLDLHLPDSTGLEVLRLLRADSTTDDIPVVAITADARETKAEQFRSAGADHFLTKPIDVHLLLEIVSGVLEERRD